MGMDNIRLEFAKHLAETPHDTPVMPAFPAKPVHFHPRIFKKRYYGGVYFRVNGDSRLRDAAKRFHEAENMALHPAYLTSVRTKAVQAAILARIADLIGPDRCTALTFTPAGRRAKRTP